MPANPLQPFIQNWSKRVALARQAGISEQALMPVFQMDLQRLKSGTTPLTNPEADAALLAAAGAPPIEKTGPTKPDWNPLHLLGGVVKDVGSTLKELPRIPGAIVKDLSHIGDMPGAIAKGGSEIASGDVGHGLQDIARAPGLQSLLLAADFVPGVDAVTLPITAGVMAAGEAGKALTPEGRKEISQHPGVTLLNLLPAAKAGDLIGGVEKAGELSESQMGRLTRQGEVTRVLTPEEIAQKIQANSAVRVPGIIRDQINRLPYAQRAIAKAEQQGFGANIRQNLYGLWSDVNNSTRAHADQFATEHGVPEWLKIPDEERNAITHQLGYARTAGESVSTSLAKAGIAPDKIPAYAPIVENLTEAITQQRSELLSDEWLAAIRLPESMGGGVEHYSFDSPVAKAYEKVDPATSRLIGAQSEVRAAQDNLETVQKGAPSSKEAFLAKFQPIADAEVKRAGPDSKLAQASELIRADRLGEAEKLLRGYKGAENYADQLKALVDKDVEKATARVGKAHVAAEAAKSSYDSALGKFHSSLERNPPARYIPRVTEERKNLFMQKAHEMYGSGGTREDPQRLTEALQAVHRQDYMTTFKDLPPPSEDARFVARDPKEIRARDAAEKVYWENRVFPQADRLLADAAKTWTDLRQAGVDPVFLHKMSEFQKGRIPSVNFGNMLTPTVIKNRSVDAAPAYEDLGIGLLRSESEIFGDRVGRAAIENHLIPHLTEDKGGLIDKIYQRHEAAGDPITRAQAEQELTRQGYMDFNTTGFRVSRVTGAKDRVIHRDIQAQIDKLGSGAKGGGWMKGAYHKGMGVYYYAVIGMSPQHVAHITATNFMAHLATEPLEALRSVRAARSLLRGEEVAGVGKLEPGVKLGFGEPTQFSRDIMELYARGNKSQARLAMESRMPAGMSAVDKAAWLPKAAMDLQTRVDAWISQTSRAMEYVIQRRKGFDPEDALNEVGKTLSLHRDFNNIERSVLRNVMPFYGFYRYLMRFTLQFPIDHPVRAGIISNFAQSEAEDWGKGLPQDLAQMFFTGHPDAKGNSTAFDIRQINPFRDVGRDFTMAGFIGALNPVLDATLQTMGVNTFSGSAELYPELTVDPNTGSLVAKRGDFLSNLAEAAVPQVRGLEGIMGWSDQLRTLSKNDPSAFHAAVARAFHFPWMPRQINIPQAKAKLELNQYRVAQQDLAGAMKTGDFSKASQYSKVPFQGQFLPPQVLKNLYQLLQSKNTGFTPNTLLRK